MNNEHQGNDMRPSILVLITIAAMIAASNTASAENAIAVESYVGQRDTEAEALLRPVLSELSKRGHLIGRALVAKVNASASHDGGRLTASQSAGAQKDVDRAYSFFIDGEYDAALKASADALELYRSAPALLTKEPPLRELQFKAFLIAARSQEVLGKGEDAFRTMAEAIRTFPDRHVSTAEFDPRVNALFRRTRVELEKQGPGSLEITCNDPSVVIFVNERYAGTGAAHVEGLFAGSYRVFVTKGDAGRLHDATVVSGATAAVAINWNLDRHLRTAGDQVRLELPAGSSARDEVAIAVSLARAVDAKAIVILSIREVEGRKAIVGTAIQTDSQTRVSAAVQAEPIAPAPETLAKLAALLSGDKNVDTRDLLVRRPDPVNSDGGPPRWYSDRWGWAIAGAGVVATGAGVGLLLNAGSIQDDADHEARQAERRELRDKADTRLWIGSGVAAVGVGVLAVGIVRLARTDGTSTETLEWSAGSVRARPAVGLGWLGVSGSF
jgi:hypothetical protein